MAQGMQGMQGALLAPRAQQKAAGLQPCVRALPVTGCAGEESLFRNPRNCTRPPPHRCPPALADPYP